MAGAVPAELAAASADPALPLCWSGCRSVFSVGQHPGRSPGSAGSTRVQIGRLPTLILRPFSGFWANFPHSMMKPTTSEAWPLRDLRDGTGPAGLTDESRSACPPPPAAFGAAQADGEGDGATRSRLRLRATAQRRGGRRTGLAPAPSPSGQAAVPARSGVPCGRCGPSRTRGVAAGAALGRGPRLPPVRPRWTGGASSDARDRRPQHRGGRSGPSRTGGAAAGRRGLRKHNSDELTLNYEYDKLRHLYRYPVQRAPAPLNQTSDSTMSGGLFWKAAWLGGILRRLDGSARELRAASWAPAAKSIKYFKSSGLSQ